MINATFIKDYSQDYNIKFDGLTIIDIVYENGKVTEIRERNSVGDYLKAIEIFKKEYEIETDDVITLIDMYFANEFSKAYKGVGIFDRSEKNED